MVSAMKKIMGDGPTLMGERDPPLCLLGIPAGLRISPEWSGIAPQSPVSIGSMGRGFDGQLSYLPVILPCFAARLPPLCPSTS